MCIAQTGLVNWTLAMHKHVANLYFMLLCKTGMKAVFHAGEARVTIVRFGRQDANLLAWGDSSGCVCIASLQEPGQLMHVRLATPTSTFTPVKAYKPMHGLCIFMFNSAAHFCN